MNNLGYNTQIHGNITRKLPVELSKTKMPCFSKAKNRELKQVLCGGWYKWERGRYKESVNEVECTGNTMLSCMKMEKMRHV
jgi:hypothetical protein